LTIVCRPVLLKNIFTEHSNHFLVEVVDIFEMAKQIAIPFSGTVWARCTTLLADLLIWLTECIVLSPIRFEQLALLAKVAVVDMSFEAFHRNSTLTGGTDFSYSFFAFAIGPNFPLNVRVHGCHLQLCC
jgi:hypothetical protein